MTDPFRVLIIVQNMPVPLDRRVWQECQALVDAGYGVSVICPRGEGQRRDQVVESVHIHTYPPPSETHGVLSYLYEFAYCWLWTFLLSQRVLRREGFDVVQSCNPPDTYFLLARLYRRRGKRFVFDQHDLCPEVYVSRFGRSGDLLHRGVLALEQATYRAADHVIVTNESYRRTALERGGLDLDEVTVVRNGPDPARMRRVAEVPELRCGRRYLCAWLGIMGPQDGVDLLMRSIDFFVHVLGRDDCQFALLGYGDCLQQLRQQAVDLRVDSWVTFTGRADADMITDYLSTAEIGLSADPRNALNDLSTMNKTMEYMTYELPVLAYDLHETRVSAADAAWYVQPNDWQAYAVATGDLLDDAAERRRLGRRGRERIEQELAWHHQVPAYVEVFRRLRKDASAGPVRVMADT